MTYLFYNHKFEQFVDLPYQFPFELLNQSEALMLREEVEAFRLPKSAADDVEGCAPGHIYIYIYT